MSPYPKCPVCKEPHPAGAKHIWGEKIDPDADTSFLAQQQGEPISRGILGREVTVPASEPVMEQLTKRDDEPEARQGSQSPCIPSESSQPSQLTSEDFSKICRKRRPGDFDRATYMREYMRDHAKAKSMGLTVAKYRKKMEGEDK